MAQFEPHHVQRAITRPPNYVAPTSLTQALHLLGSEGVRPLAGGTDLLIELDRGARSEVHTLVDVSAIGELTQIKANDDQIVVGAAVTYNQILASEVCRRHALPLVQAAAEIGSPQLRNHATVGGNIVTASPANDTIAPLMVLGAEIEIQSAVSRRRVAMEDFITGFRTTVLEPGELVTSITIPIIDGQVGIFVKAGLRKAQAISVVNLAITRNGDEIRCAVGSVGPTVVMTSGTDIDEVISPIDDLRATAEYRRAVTKTMIRRGLAALDQPSSFQPPPLLQGQRPSSDGPTATEVGEGAEVTVVVNGTPVSGPNPTASLLDWLRDNAATNGVKEGCAEGECGACTIDLDGAAVMSCLVAAGRAHNRQVQTVEGLDDHPVQTAFVAANAVQCGFCTPGFIMAGVKLLEECPNADRQQVAAGLAGNLCRCTGYEAIHNALQEAQR